MTNNKILVYTKTRTNIHGVWVRWEIKWSFDDKLSPEHLYQTSPKLDT